MVTLQLIASVAQLLRTVGSDGQDQNWQVTRVDMTGHELELGQAQQGGQARCTTRDPFYLLALLGNKSPQQSGRTRPLPGPSGLWLISAPTRTTLEND